jgi:predicted ArsR family transcriptional regulator
LVQRREVRQARGRPSFVYVLSETAERFFGANYCDLAVCLWEAICAIEDPKARQRVISQVRESLVQMYRKQVGSGDPSRRLEGFKQILAERGIDAEIDNDGDSPVLRQHDCPYAGLAFTGHSICTFEKEVLAELLGSSVTSRTRRLTDQSTYCEFEIRDQP